jgi:hypothetical protein
MQFVEDKYTRAVREDRLRSENEYLEKQRALLDTDGFDVARFAQMSMHVGDPRLDMQILREHEGEFPDPIEAPSAKDEEYLRLGIEIMDQQGYGELDIRFMARAQGLERVAIPELDRLRAVKESNAKREWELDNLGELTESDDEDTKKQLMAQFQKPEPTQGSSGMQIMHDDDAQLTESDDDDMPDMLSAKEIANAKKAAYRTTRSGMRITHDDGAQLTESDDDEDTSLSRYVPGGGAGGRKKGF